MRDFNCLHQLVFVFSPSSYNVSSVTRQMVYFTGTEVHTICTYVYTRGKEEYTIGTEMYTLGT